MAGVVQQVTTGLRLDLGPLKEPLGFIRVLEWVFCIFAFATACGYSGTTQIKLKCSGGQDELINAHFGYPFRLRSQPFQMPNCNGTTDKAYLIGDLSSSAEFFVCVGVFGFLYCTFALVLYLGYQHLYRDGTRGPVIDLFVTGAFSFLWLVSSSAWGKALTDIKWYTSPQYITDVILDTCKTHPGVCSPGEVPAMGRLNASVIFGFLNLILWGSNCWFIYKETPFHKPISPPATEEGPGSS